jgi:hypothetical protein
MRPGGPLPLPDCRLPVDIDRGVCVWQWQWQGALAQHATDHGTQHGVGL